MARVVEIRPLAGDNLNALSWASRADFKSFLYGIPDSYPEWRPLAFLTLWAQYQIAGIEYVESWFVVNLLLWVLCACLVYVLVVQVTGSMVASFAASAVFLVDPLSLSDPIIWITGRQTTLMCVLGFSAMLIAMNVWRIRPGLVRYLLVFTLLVGAALSKEYGLAFVAAVFVAGFTGRREDDGSLMFAALLSGLAYGCLRLLIVGGATGPYCNEMGFLLQVREVCYRDLSLAATLGQFAYNVVAAFIGTLLSGLIRGSGALQLQLAVLPFSLIWLAFASVSWLKQSRQTLPLLSLIVFGAVLSFLVYRDRNLVMGTMALCCSGGIGLAWLASHVKRPVMALVCLAAIAPTLMVWLAARAVRVERGLQEYVDESRAKDPCPRLVDSRYERTVIVGLKHKYGMSDAECEALVTPRA